MKPALEIRFLDVGQGDAILVSSGGRIALIDTGPADGVVRRLRQLGVDSLALLLISHNHADHLGGADAVLDSIPVRFFLDNGVPAGTAAHARVLRGVERKRITYLRPEPRTLTLGSARINIDPAPRNTGDGQNNQSLVVTIEQGDFRALLPGDSETPQLSAMVADIDLPDVDVLKAAHHGSRNGLTPLWLFRTRPEVVVVSAGRSNGYGHPALSALRYYCAGGRRVFRTDRNGDVVVRVSEGGSYEVLASRPGASGCESNGAGSAGR